MNVHRSAKVLKCLLFFSAVQDIKDSLKDSSKATGCFEFFHSRSGGSIEPGLASSCMVKEAIDLDVAIQTDSNPNPEPKWIRESIHCNDNLLYLYTSGTTGLPKAVIIKHVRYTQCVFLIVYVGLDTREMMIR